jgi:hypothetical protein
MTTEPQGHPIDQTAPVSPAGEPPGPPPGWRAVLGRALDLNVAASRHVRGTSIRIGLLVLAAAAPLLLILLAVAQRLGGLDDLGGQILLERQVVLATGDAGAGVLVAFLVGGYCLAALSIDSQLLAVVLIASAATSRPFDAGSALRLVRLRFWRLLRANILIGIILVVPRWIVEQAIAPRGVVTESQFLLLTVLGILLSMPFAFVSAWIVLGAVGAGESVRRSWRLARAHPALALLIAVVNVATQTIAAFALGAGADLLFRLADQLGLDRATGPGLFVPLAAITILGVVAAGSLIFTIAALTAAPQVVAFLGVTGVDAGLDAVRDPGPPPVAPRREPFVSRPMKIGLVVEAVFAALAVSRLL